MRIVIGEGSCGIAAGARKVHAALDAVCAAAERKVETGVTGCNGMCYLEPIVDLYDGDGLAARLVKVQESDAARIYSAAESGDLSGIKDLLISADDAQFLEKQTRIALRHCGVIDPESIESYRAADGYGAIAKILGKDGSKGLSPEQVIEEI